MTAPQKAEPDVEVRAYARQVRAALADVPADRLTELLDDLEEHLVEVAAEGGEPLAVRLGPPAEYASELRQAAGLAEPSEPSGATASTAPAAASWSTGISAGLDRVTASPQYAALRDFLPELRPAWWVLRAWAPLVALDAVFFGSSSFPVPSLGLGPLVGPVVGLVVTGAAITWSVRRGMRDRREPERGDPRVAMVVNGLLALLTLVALVAVADQPEPAMAYSYDEPGFTDLAHEDGTAITNIHPYSASGEPLEGVLLYDQDGRPIDNVAPYTSEGEEVQRLETDPPAPANAFPQQQRVYAFDEPYPRWTTPSPGSPTPAVPSAPAPSTSAAPSAPASPAPDAPEDAVPGAPVQPFPGPEVPPLPGPAPEPFPAPAPQPAP